VFPNLPSDDIATMAHLEKAPTVDTSKRHLLSLLRGNLVKFSHQFLSGQDLTPNLGDAEQLANEDTFT